MYEKLNHIFLNVNDLLKFAEAKNALIIVFNSTLIFGILSFYSKIKEENIYLMYMFMIITMLLIAIVISLLSFIPTLKFLDAPLGRPNDNDNLIFFGDIAKYTPSIYYEKLNDIIPNLEDNKSLDMQYINQIIINSKITMNKFRQFEVSAWFTIGAFLTPIGMLLLYLYKKFIK